MKYLSVLFLLFLVGCVTPKTKIEEVLPIALNGDTLKIAIIDTGLDLTDPRFRGHICPTGHKSYVGHMDDIVGHGTHVAGLIQKFAGEGNYCFMIYNYYSETVLGNKNMERQIQAIQDAILNKATIINLSGGGTGYDPEEYKWIKSHPEVTLVVAAGNEGIDLDVPSNTYYPASYLLKNVISVGSLKLDRTIASYSNRGKKVSVWEIGSNVVSTMPSSFCDKNVLENEGYKKIQKENGLTGCIQALSGTSMATAIHTGKLVNKLLRGNDGLFRK